MGKVKAAVMEGEEFAQDNYNLTRPEFSWAALKRFGGHTLEYQAAIQHFDVIQKELDVYFDEANNGVRYEKGI